MKYARFIPREDGTTQVIDVLDLGVPPYDQRPLLGCTTDADLLAKLFSPQLIAQWDAQGYGFQSTLPGVQNSATLSGDPALPGSYLNPDGSDGNGDFPQVVEALPNTP